MCGWEMCVPLALYDICQLRYLVGRPRRLTEYLEVSSVYNFVSNCWLVVQTRKSSIVTAMIVWSFPLVCMNRQGSDLSCVKP